MSDERTNTELSNEEQPKAKATIKHILLLVLLLILIVASFWFSFQLGKKILLPAKDVGSDKIKVEIPQVPASIADLQDTAEIDNKISSQPPLAQAVACSQPKTVGEKWYKVQAGFFKDLRNANARKAVLRDKGFEVFIKKIAGGYRVQLGAFKKKSSATALRNRVTASGIQAVVIYE